MHFRLSLVLLTVLSLSAAFLLGSHVNSQTKDKKKHKDFGSSLKQLKWNPERNTGNDSGSNARMDSDDDVIRIDTSLVALDVLVVNKDGRVVEGLKESDFAITEDGNPQVVGHFLLGDNANLPRSIVLIIDYSGSQLPFIENSVAAAKILVDKLGPADRMAIVTDDVEMLVDFTADKKKLKQNLDSLVEKAKGTRGVLGFGRNRQLGRSAQYSALMATLKEAFDAEEQRPIIVFQTDGDEAEYLRNSIVTPSVPPNLPPELRVRAQQEVEQRLKLQRQGMTEFSLDDVYHEVEKSRATIYTVISGTRLLGLPFAEQVARLKAEDEKRISDWLASVKSTKLRE